MSFRKALLLILLVSLFTVTISITVAQEEKVVTIGLASEPPTLDHRNYNLTPSTFAIVWQIYEPLLYHDTRTDELIPGLAIDFEQLDESSYLFHLRETTWHDGEPFNADDVVWTLTRTNNKIREYGLDPENPVEKVDDYTVIIHTNGPNGPFLKQNLPLNMYMLPEHVLESYYTEARNAEYEETTDADGNAVTAEENRDATLHSIDKGGDLWTDPEPNYIGTGPFMFESWERGTELVLAANDDYWGGRPNVDKLVYRWVEEDTSRIIGLEAGDFDLILGIPASDVERLQSVDDVEVLISPGLGYHMVTINQSVETLSDARVRQAIAYAIDQDEIISLYGDLATRTCGPLSVNSGFYNAEVNCFDYDPDMSFLHLDDAR